MSARHKLKFCLWQPKGGTCGGRLAARKVERVAAAVLLSTCAAASMLGPMLLLLLHTRWRSHGHVMTDKDCRVLLLLLRSRCSMLGHAGSQAGR